MTGYFYWCRLRAGYPLASLPRRAVGTYGSPTHAPSCLLYTSKTAAYQIAPERAITVETTTACDIPQVKEDKQVCALGKGPVVSFMDKGTVYDMDLYTKAMACAQRNNIPCQAKAGVYGGNESRSVQAAGKGCRVLAVSVPCRYLHTPSCVIKEEDMENTLRLLEALLDEFGA